MQGGLLAKARRGECASDCQLVWWTTTSGRWCSIPTPKCKKRWICSFERSSERAPPVATLKHFSDHHIPFPAPAKAGATTEDVVWGRLNLGRAVPLLHNPRYVGAFSHGRRHCRKQPNARPRTTTVPRDQWHALLLDAHPGYI